MSTFKERQKEADEFRKYICDRIKRLRRANWKSTKALADEALIDPPALYHYESGARIPRLVYFVRLAKAFNMSVDQLLGKYGCLPEEGSERHQLWQMIEEMPEQYFRAIEHIVKDYYAKYKEFEEEEQEEE